MVHLRSYHTRIEDVQQTYDPARVKDVLNDIDHDTDALTALGKACRCRLAELSKVEYIQYVEIKRTQDYGHNNRIVFYVGLHTAAIVDGKEVHIDSTDNQKFWWEGKKDAAKYAMILADKHGVVLRDLSGKGGTPP